MHKKYFFIFQKEKLAAPVNLRPAGWTGATKKLIKARGENENKKKVRIKNKDGSGSEINIACYHTHLHFT